METVQETKATKAPEITEAEKELKPITDQYFQLCAQLGDLYVKQGAINEEIDKKNIEVANLNHKYKKTLEKFKKETTTNGATNPTKAN